MSAFRAILFFSFLLLSSGACSMGPYSYSQLTTDMHTHTQINLLQRVSVTPRVLCDYNRRASADFAACLEQGPGRLSVPNPSHLVPGLVTKSPGQVQTRVTSPGDPSGLHIDSTRAFMGTVNHKMCTHDLFEFFVQRFIHRLFVLVAQSLPLSWRLPLVRDFQQLHYLGRTH